MNPKRISVEVLGLAAAALLLAVVPVQGATYQVWGGTYAADPLPEGSPPPPSILPSALTPDEIVGEEEFFPTGVLGMVRVDVIAHASNTVLASTLGLLGPYYVSFTDPATTLDVRFSIHDAATGEQFYETGPVVIAAGVNKRYLLAPLPVAEVGGASLIPHPSEGSAYAFTRVGLVEAANIGSDGLADFAGATPHWRDAPFGRTLSVFGAASTTYYPWFGPGQYCYKVRVSPPSGPDFYIDDPLYKTTYTVDASTTPATVTSDSVQVGPFSVPGGASGCYHFTPMMALAPGGNSIFWSFPDQLAKWNTVGEANGLHELTLEVYRRSDGDNQGVAGAALPLHLDNRGVTLAFNAVEQRSASDVTQVDLMSNPCDIVHLTGGRKLFIEFTAHHAGGYLATYSLTAVRNLGATVTFASGSYDPSTMLPNAFTGVNPDTVNVLATDLVGSCAYNVRLRAWARTTNGYGRLFHPWRHLAYYIQTP